MLQIRTEPLVSQAELSEGEVRQHAVHAGSHVLSPALYLAWQPEAALVSPAGGRSPPAGARAAWRTGMLVRAEQRQR